MTSELKSEMHSLLNELHALSLRNDELMNERDQDAQQMHDMEIKVQEYKRKWEGVRIELRNLKGKVKIISQALMNSYIDNVRLQTTV